MSENDTSAGIDWPDLGAADNEARWRELGKAAGASELQLRFAAVRFGGASAGRAAKIAGYAGTDAQGFRRQGYDAVRSTAVQHLLELAAVNAPDGAGLTAKEIDARIAKLVRSADPNIALKAVEAHAKRAERRQEQLEGEVEWVGPAHTLAGFLEYLPDARGAVVASLMGWYWEEVPKADRRFYLEPFLDDLAPHVAAEFPDVWRRLVSDGINDWVRGALAELADRPRKPIAQIVQEAKDRGRIKADPFSPPPPVAESEITDAAQ